MSILWCLCHLMPEIAKLFELFQPVLCVDFADRSGGGAHHQRLAGCPLAAQVDTPKEFAIGDTRGRKKDVPTADKIARGELTGDVDLVSLDDRPLFIVPNPEPALNRSSDACECGRCHDRLRCA